MQTALEKDFKIEDYSFAFSSHIHNAFFMEVAQLVQVNVLNFIFNYLLIFFFSLVYLHFPQAEYEKLGGRILSSKHENDTERMIEDFEMTELSELACLKTRHNVCPKHLFILKYSYMY